MVNQTFVVFATDRIACRPDGNVAIEHLPLSSEDYLKQAKITGFDAFRAVGGGCWRAKSPMPFFIE
mgnify:CR=1 FL=1